jgi:hypothetical protein
MNKREKTGGRTKGTPNKTTAEIRERFTSLLVSKIDTMQSDLNSLEPKDRIKTLLEISKFVIPKPIDEKAVKPLVDRFEFDVPELTKEQVDKLIDKL